MKMRRFPFNRSFRRETVFFYFFDFYKNFCYNIYRKLRKVNTMTIIELFAGIGT